MYCKGLTHFGVKFKMTTNGYFFYLTLTLTSKIFGLLILYIEKIKPKRFLFEMDKINFVWKNYGLNYLVERKTKPLS